MKKGRTRKVAIGREEWRKIGRMYAEREEVKKVEMSDRRERNDKRNGGREEGLQGMTLQGGGKREKEKC